MPFRATTYVNYLFEPFQTEKGDWRYHLHYHHKEKMDGILIAFPGLRRHIIKNV